MTLNIPSKFNPFPVYYNNGGSPEPPGPDPLTFEVLKDNSIINLIKKGNPPGGGFKYKINNGDWQDFIFGNYFQLNTGDKISFRGTSNLLNSTDNDYYCFGYGGTSYPVTANFKVYGHINSMCNYSDELQTYQYCKLFSDDPRSYTWPHIVDASGVILPEYNDPNKSGVFRYLFAGQTALRCGPNVSGTVIATEGVGYMFYNCRSLTAAPSFEPTVAGKHSFYRTFAKCSNLIVPPQINVQEPSIAGASCIFKQMFSGCTSLTSTPYIPMQDVTLGSFQNMFAGCTSLISASELPATTINQQSYQGMFKGCTNLLSAPIMHFSRPATSGCQYMFSGCTNLKYINCQFVDWTKDANGTTMQYSFTDWVNGVQTTSGTFIKDSSLATEYRTSRIPNNWTVVNK